MTIFWSEDENGELIGWDSDDTVELRMPLWQAVIIQCVNLFVMARGGVPYAIIRDEIYAMLLGDEIIAWLRED